MEKVNVIPKNLMAEVELLSHCIQSEDILCEIIGSIKDDDFYDIRNSLIFASLTNLFQKGTSISMTTLIKELGANIEQITITYVSSIIGNAIPRLKDAKECAKIVKETSKRRKLIKATQELLQKTYDETIDLKKLVGEFEEKVDIVDDGEKKTLFDMEQTITSTITKIEENYNNGGKVVGMETGFTTLDRCLNGFVKQDLNIIAARPSMGKTVFSLNLAERLSRKHSVYYASIEMNKEKLCNRLLASLTKIDGMKISTGNIGEDEWIKIGKASSFLSNNRLFIDESPSITMLDIKSKAKKIKMQHGLDVIIIDHLGLVKPLKNRESRNLEIGDITWMAKVIAKELDCCVILLSQLSRAPELRADHRPILSDLRESGNIEQDADNIIGLYRDEYYNKESEDRGILESIILKARDGKVGTVKMAYIDKYQFIGELDVIHQ